MKTLISFAAIVAGFVGSIIYDGTGPGTNCRVAYARSFDGLYLIKELHCGGRLGMNRAPREIARRPLFLEF